MKKNEPKKNNIELFDSDLLNYSEIHIKYEFDMMVVCYKVLEEIVVSKSNNPLIFTLLNPYVTAFAIHCRNLIEFRYTIKPNGDDINLKSYILKDEILLSLPPKPKILSDAKIKANKQTAHLTRKRIYYENNNKEWRFGEIAQCIHDGFLEVIDLIPDYKFSPSLKNIIRNPNFLSIYPNFSLRKTNYKSQINFIVNSN